MSQQELSEARGQLEDAQREKTELDALIQGLEEQVREGNEHQAVEELGRQWSVRRLVELRQEAAERRLLEAEALERERQLREKVAAAEADLTQLTPAQFAPAFDEAVSALEKLAAMGAAYQEAVNRHARALVDAGSDHVAFHQEGVFTALRFGGHEFRTSDSYMTPAALLKLVQDERARRAQLPDRLAKGFAPLEPLPHPVTRHIAEQAEAEL
ncbi:hypothetical protein ACFYY3_01085 [Streptomyces sp. NPDC001812]|uniref:hypothetical protein n=1 Tax=Streptomyces sp. NPDC001812 TaxID=3364611 RepID=UPI0036BDC5BE